MTLAKVYIRYKKDLPESEMMYCALTGFQARGTETAPFYGFGDINDLDDLGPSVGIVGYIGDIWRALAKLRLPKPGGPAILDGPVVRSVKPKRCS